MTWWDGNGFGPVAKPESADPRRRSRAHAPSRGAFSAPRSCSLSRTHSGARRRTPICRTWTPIRSPRTGGLGLRRVLAPGHAPDVGGLARGRHLRRASFIGPGQGLRALEEPIEVLRRRLSAGEITPEEFEGMPKILES